MIDHDHIAMQVPATAASAPLIRLAAAQLTAQCGFDLDHVEDVRIAVAEAVRILVGAPGERDATADGARILADFDVADHEIVATIGLQGALDAVGFDATSTRILDATTASYGFVVVDTGEPAITMQFTMGNEGGVDR